MENNFYVGVVSHERGLARDAYHEKVVLYTENNTCYTDLLKGKTYSTDSNEREYVLKDTLIKTDIDDFNIDYLYLLNKFKNSGKKKKKTNIF